MPSRFFKYRNRVLFLNLFILIFLAIYFQNCVRNIKFTEFSEDLSSTLNAETTGVQFRTQVITPSYNQVVSSGDVKVLMVVDNSPTMGNSQANLNKNLNSLLGQIQNYSASVKIVSTSYFDSSCNGSNCTTKPALAYSWFNGSTTVEGHAATSRMETLADNPQNVTFKFEKNMTEAQKAAVISSIRTRVSELGVRGLNSESQFAAFASQMDSTISTFFKKGDKALIYVLTDEDDSYSISSFQQPRYAYSESANWNTVAPGLQFLYPGFRTGSATCAIRDEAGNYVGTDFRMPMSFRTMTECQQFLTDAAGGSCDWGTGCSAAELISNSTYALNGKTMAVRCAEVAVEVAPYYPTVTRCIPADVISWESIVGTNISTYLFNWDKSMFATPDYKSKMFKTVNSKLTELFGTKYLIGVSTNLQGQSCALQVGQSYDSFFSKELAKEIPAANLMISSICDANNDDQAVKRIANEFESIMNNDYLVSLAPHETIDSVRAVISGNSVVLKDGVDYKIVSNTFKTLSPQLQNFERIEIKIKSLQ